MEKNSGQMQMRFKSFENTVLEIFCKSNFSMIKYSNFMGRNSRISAFLPNCNIARIFRHVKGGLVRDRKIYPWTWRKICAK